MTHFLPEPGTVRQPARVNALMAEHLTRRFRASGPATYPRATSRRAAASAADRAGGDASAIKRAGAGGSSAWHYSLATRADQLVVPATKTSPPSTGTIQAIRSGTVS